MKKDKKEHYWNAGETQVKSKLSVPVPVINDNIKHWISQYTTVMSALW